ncbi:carbonic anhydrase [Actinoplanes xinjiangensis]|jgi:carbonic anhydrase|uniref:Carbonic anhydrase n=1 Tax=Actinoplanes xinjiangensis TaxID=512350 RepID=A0A316G530_9ACTN|nr:carbonic anhydrase [Actinoplanes xinjiangensis]PWK49527.1 carbonic anhydrase [Actinoplanes xinjiangensis]GIF37533.1 carbonic anhydrase [Actinoplanes xinjiangensis]
MTATRDAQVSTSSEALSELIAGNKRFVYGRPRYGHDVARAAATANGQKPHSLVFGCIDSRVPLEAIFDQTFGSICVARSGAHVLDRSLIGSINFAVAELGVSLVLVVGHKRCGAVHATVEALRAGATPGGDVGYVGYLVDELAPAVQAVGLDGEDTDERAVREHVGRTVDRLRDVPELAHEIAADRIRVVGAVYDLDSGWVEFLP